MPTTLPKVQPFTVPGTPAQATKSRHSSGLLPALITSALAHEYHENYTAAHHALPGR